MQSMTMVIPRRHVDEEPHTRHFNAEDFEPRPMIADAITDELRDVNASDLNLDDDDA